MTLTLMLLALSILMYAPAPEAPDTAPYCTDPGVEEGTECDDPEGTLLDDLMRA